MSAPMGSAPAAGAPWLLAIVPLVLLAGPALAVDQVGAWADEDLGEDSGSVYVFERDPSDPDAWLETAKLLPSDGGPEDRCGYDVAVSGDRILVGCHQWGSGVGKAYLFQRDPLAPTGWREAAKLTPSDGVVGDGFGSTVDISGDTAVVGAPDGSAAYVYSLDRLLAERPGGWSRE